MHKRWSCYFACSVSSPLFWPDALEVEVGVEGIDELLLFKEVGERGDRGGNDDPDGAAAADKAADNGREASPVDVWSLFENWEDDLGRAWDGLKIGAGEAAPTSSESSHVLMIC